MKFQELLMKRRSIRQYQNKEISIETIMQIINDCVYAPSSRNEQPWKFIIVNNKELMNEMSSEAKHNLLNEIKLSENHYAKRYENMLSNDNYNIFYNAPAVIYIIGEKNLKNIKVNCSLAASYFMMSATSHGLGTCWINFGMFLNQDTRKKLGISEDHEIIAPIIIGYPAKVPEMPKRKNPDILKIVY